MTNHRKQPRPLRLITVRLPALLHDQLKHMAGVRSAGSLADGGPTVSLNDVCVEALEKWINTNYDLLLEDLPRENLSRTAK